MSGIATKQTKRKTLFTAQGANGVSTEMNVSSYKTAVISIGTTGLAAMTIKVRGAIAETKGDVNIGAAKSETNVWDYVAIRDFDTGLDVTGTTGKVFAGASDYKNYEINVSLLDFIAVEVVGWTVGTVTVEMKAGDNT